MSEQMADPHIGMLSFQEGLHAGILELYQTPKHSDLYLHVDEPAPGEHRMTYVRLTDDRKTVLAFVNCLMNGHVDGFPCLAVGYAVPESMRNQGYAKQILRDVIQDQVYHAGRAGVSTLYIEAVIDITNLPSQKVAEAVFNVERESITDRHSGLPAFRYTAHFDTATGIQL
ncbi:GNAT family N-acetyltransferase [Burkholderia glumae]|uniref:GNAT family N-acetyltransferase n=1 Tax=Burkholderia glumae TaxID=337 RepID=UPI00214F7321|nr:GNAT family N-acetyltransferase [Burkholderia glumae]UVS89113.1 hypothetical protein EFP17_04505 [Burkholderia glumae]